MKPQDPQEILSNILTLKGEALNLPLPRRMELAPVAAYRAMLMGGMKELIDECAELNFTAAHFVAVSSSHPSCLELASKLRGLTPSSYRTAYMIGRHQHCKGSIFSVSDGLNLLLDDTKAREDIPIRFFAAPSRCCYIEFSEPPSRETCTFRVYSGGKEAILEGCYIQESVFDRPPNMHPQARELLELDPRAKTRVVDVGFTSSPQGLRAGIDKSVMQDTIDTISLYIQDENEPYSEVLRRHQQLNLSSFNLGQNTHSPVFESLCDNTARLSKILFYLSVERDDRKEIREYSDLAERIKGVADKKKPKLEKMLNRTYDRIVVGPKHYTPIAQRIASQHLPAGTRSPHYRAGYFGIRWIGTGEYKQAELRRVKETIVNEHLLKGDSQGPRDYLIR